MNKIVQNLIPFTKLHQSNKKDPYNTFDFFKQFSKHYKTLSTELNTKTYYEFNIEKSQKSISTHITLQLIKKK